MPQISKSILVPYSAQQMYSLVTDVPSYTTYLPWCSKAYVNAQHDDGYTATIEFNLKGIKKSFTTRNTTRPYQEIEMKLVSGPFQSLHGYWKFTDLGENSCKVEFELNYQFSSRILESTVGPVFKKISSSMVEAFHSQAVKQFGTPKNDSD